MPEVRPFPCDEGVMLAGEADAECPESSRPWVLAATTLGSSVAFLNGSVVTVALPAMQDSLDASVTQIQWIVNAHALALGALLLFGGAAGDRYGRRRIFLLGVAAFGLTSLFCGLAPNTELLIVARALQGIAGALLVPNSLAVIRTSFPDEERGKAIGTWAAFTALTTAAGPLAGGWLVDGLSWRSIFFLVVPLTVFTYLAGSRHILESRDDSVTGMDWRGAALGTLGLAALTYGLITSSESGWTDPLVIGAVAAGLAMLVAFVIAEARGDQPMMPLRLFHEQTFVGANLMTLLLYFSLTGALFFLPFNFIQVRGYSAAAAGAAFLPLTVVIAVLSRWSGGLVDTVGPKLPLTVGPLVAAVGFAMLAIPGTDGSYWTAFLPALLVIGLGMAISAAPLTTVVMNSVSDRDAGIASGVNNAASRIAGLLAVAILTVLALAAFGDALDSELENETLSSEARAAASEARDELTGATLPETLDAGERQTLETAIDDSFVASFRLTMLIAAALAAGAGISAGLLIRTRDIEAETPTPETAPAN